MKALRLVVLILVAITIASGGDTEVIKEALAFLGLFFVPIFIIGITVKVLR